MDPDVMLSEREKRWYVKQEEVDGLYQYKILNRVIVNNDYIDGMFITFLSEYKEDFNLDQFMQRARMSQ